MYGTTVTTDRPTEDQTTRKIKDPREKISLLFSRVLWFIGTMRHIFTISPKT